MVSRFLSAGVVLLSFIYLWATYSLPPVRVGDPLGPKVFPYLVSGLLIITSGLVFISSFKEAPSESDVDEPHKPVAVLLTTIGLFVYFFLLEPLGFVVSTAIFVLAMTSYFNRGRWIPNLSVALLFPIATDIVFTKFLGISLPGGLLQLIGLA